MYILAGPRGLKPGDELTVCLTWTPLPRPTILPLPNIVL